MTTERRCSKLNEKEHGPVQAARPEPETARPRKRWKRILAAILIPILLLAALWFGGSLLFPKVFNVDTVTRFFRYMGLKNKEDYGKIRFEADASNVTAGFGNGLVVAEKSGLTLYDLEGQQRTFVQAALEAPVVCTGEAVCACYTPGNSYLAVIDEAGEVLSDGPASGKLLDVDVSEDGFLAALTVESGYKTVATVRNIKQEPI